MVLKNASPAFMNEPKDRVEKNQEIKTSNKTKIAALVMVHSRQKALNKREKGIKDSKKKRKRKKNAVIHRANV